MDDHFYNVSDRLCQVLDWVGVSNEVRSQHKETATVSEILNQSVVLRSSLSTQYYFGSFCEGTTTPGLKSDIDFLNCFHITVVERISDVPPRGQSYVMVRDESTKPGYVKLQTVYNGVPQTIYHRPNVPGAEYTDHRGRICHKHISGLLPFPCFNERNGPAISRTEQVGLVDLDIVFGFRCSHIPTFAQSWVSRHRLYSWPRPHQLDKMKRYGCFLVGVNHPSSQNGPIEWRVSFSLQERELMLTLNHTQHKCYVLLKMIKKDIIHKRAPKSISSYHCKTCLFYVIENTPPEFWTRRNLLECSRVCIKRLLQWVREQNCPNYFIPDENMFDRLKPEALRLVKTVLEDILEHWCGFLWSLACDNVGNVLLDVLFGSGPGVLCVRNKQANENRLSLCLVIQRDLLNCIKNNLHFFNGRSSSTFLKQLYTFKLSLYERVHATEHTEEDTRLAISYFMPHLHLQMSQCLASIMLNVRDERLLNVMFRAFMYCISESRDCDLMSTNLIVASFCLQSDRFEMCEKFLLDCEIVLRTTTVSVCGCRSNVGRNSKQTRKLLLKHFNGETPIFRQFRTHTTGCLTFLPCESNLVPWSALHYEMYRSDYPNLVYWYNWIVVDSQVYFYFLQYILYTKTNRPICRQDALDNLVRVIRTGDLGHPETADNLLGWIYRQEHNLQKAMQCFLTSLRMAPNHNAARWQMFELIQSLNRPGSGHM